MDIKSCIIKLHLVYGILHDQYGEFFSSRQEDRDSEHDSPSDTLEKLTSMSTDDISLTDWHLGFHISLGSSEFHKRSFQTAVASIKAIAASHLWQVTNAKINFSCCLKKIHLWIFAISAVVVRAELDGQLKAL
ncbi:gamma-tubulin complex component 4 [Olea europaea subsp. europaea]|uniref:Gamma-tubulin complex component 4 n=1 Tax=Olea europaea subsp. europaea TaxID=158383 RepID=A0A8S0T6V8_OLEEU|nr:gamma-tubulin complex component 4 [Olea europaea subsp. europaea]